MRENCQNASLIRELWDWWSGTHHQIGTQGAKKDNILIWYGYYKYIVNVEYDDNLTMIYHDNRQWRQLTSGLRSWRTRIDCQPGRNRAWRQVGTGRRSDEGSEFDSLGLFFIVGSVLVSRSSRWFLRAGTTELEYELSCICAQDEGGYIFKNKELKTPAKNGTWNDF